MNEADKVIARIYARAQGRAVVVRERSSLSSDPLNAIGIATIKVVTEDQVQALAFGSLGQQPMVISRLNPMSRDTADLEPFATWFVSYIDGCLKDNEMVRVWVPHRKTVETLAIMGRRYEKNKAASSNLQKGARYCRIIAEELHFTGQQTVAVAADLLISHTVTGQMPIEDQHLGSLLAWVNPVPGTSASVVAAERSRFPASGVLVNTPDQHDDDRVEKYRKEMKSAPEPLRRKLAEKILEILSRGVLREWDLMVEARSAFLRLSLPELAMQDLINDSKKRINWFVGRNYYFIPRDATGLAERMAEYEDSLQKNMNYQLQGDTVIRSLGLRQGHVLRGTVTEIIQPTPRRSPCTLVLNTDQTNLRVRFDDKLQAVETNVTGIVRDIEHDRVTNHTRLRIEVTKGFKSVGSLQNALLDWIDTTFPLFQRKKILKEAGQRRNWMVVGNPPPQPVPTRFLEGDPLELAHRAAKVRP